MPRGIDQVVELERRIETLEDQVIGVEKRLTGHHARLGALKAVFGEWDWEQFRGLAKRVDALEGPPRDPRAAWLALNPQDGDTLVISKFELAEIYRRLEVLEGPPSFEMRWMAEEKEILLAAIEYIELWEPGDDVPPIGQESVFDRLQSAVLAYQALQRKHEGPPEELKPSNSFEALKIVMQHFRDLQEKPDPE